jgi:hypothetical protein
MSLSRITFGVVVWSDQMYLPQIAPSFRQTVTKYVRNITDQEKRRWPLHFFNVSSREV